MIIIFIVVLYLHARKFILFCIIYVLNLYPYVLNLYFQISLFITLSFLKNNFFFLFIDIGILLSWKIFEIDTFMYEFKKKEKRTKKKKNERNPRGNEAETVKVM